MPFLKLETTVVLSEEKKKTLLGSLSRTVAGTLGKPEQYMMVSISQSELLMSGTSAEAASLDIRSIGSLSGDTNRKLSHQVCQFLKESLSIPPDRIFLNFTDVDASNWGWNGTTFG